MPDKFPEAFTAADPAAQFDVIKILFGDDMMPGLLDVLDEFDNAAPHIQHCCMLAVGLVK